MKVQIALIFIIYFLIITVKKAYAYVDLGSGSYVFQLVIGVLLGGCFAAKMYWKEKIRPFLSKFFLKEKKDNG